MNSFAEYTAHFAQFCSLTRDQLAPRASALDLEGICDSLLRGVDPKGEYDTKLVSAICSMAAQAVQRKMAPDQLTQQLEQIHDECGLKRAFLSAYNANFGGLQAALKKANANLGVHPTVVGMDWSILSVVESTDDAEIEEPLAEIAFKTLGPDQGGEETLKFVCNKNQLQDFHWKVREACNFVQKMMAAASSNREHSK